MGGGSGVVVTAVIAVVLLVVFAQAKKSGGGGHFYYVSHDEKVALSSLDFRGCWSTVCLYVGGDEPWRKEDRRVAAYNETLWIRKDWGAKPDILVADRKPHRLGTEINTRVPQRRVLPSNFSARVSGTSEKNPRIVELLSFVSEDNLRTRDEKLASWFTRNSLSKEAVEVSQYLQTELENLGCTDVELQGFRNGYSPNVYCTLVGTDSSLSSIVVGAHYDSRSTGLTDPSQRAPGADDNGSGSAAVLHLLDIIRAHGFKFKRNIIVAFFSGEEQGLYGSDALSALFRKNQVDLAAMVNLDMIGYPQRDSNGNKLPNIYWMSGAVNKALTNLAISLSELYLPTVPVSTTSACCSDQQSFNSDGYAAASIFESKGAGNNPNYHRSSDLPDTVDFGHVASCASAAYALLSHVAEIEPK